MVDVKRPRCPFCGATENQQCYGKDGGNVLYYRCGVCVYPNADGTHTRYKAVLI